MNIFFIIIGLSVLGIGAVIWLLLQDQKSSKEIVEKMAPEEIGGGAFTISPPAPPPLQAKKGVKSPPKEKGRGLFNKLKFGPKSKPSSISLPISLPIEKKGEEGKKKSGGSLFGKLGLNKLSLGKFKEENLEVPEPAPLPGLKDFLEQEKKKKGEYSPSFGSASLKTQPSEEPVKSPTMEIVKTPTPLSAEDEKKLERELDASLELTELKNKYGRLEKMFQEKSTSLEHSEQALKTEHQTQKEFNKVKDILEKELKDTRDNARKIQVELTATKTESEIYKRRITQLEEKATKLEREITEKEKEVDSLVKKLQTFASPATAATPPKPKEQSTTQGLPSSEQESRPSTPQVKETKEEPSLPPFSQPITERNPPSETPESGEGNTSAEFLSLKPDILSKPSMITPKESLPTLETQKNIEKIENQNPGEKQESAGEQPSHQPPEKENP